MVFPAYNPLLLLGLPYFPNRSFRSTILALEWLSVALRGGQ
jgi:hypothetical protein